MFFHISSILPLVVILARSPSALFFVLMFYPASFVRSQPTLQEAIQAGRESCYKNSPQDLSIALITCNIPRLCRRLPDGYPFLLLVP